MFTSRPYCHRKEPFEVESVSIVDEFVLEFRRSRLVLNVRLKLDEIKRRESFGHGGDVRAGSGVVEDTLECFFIAHPWDGWLRSQGTSVLNHARRLSRSTRPP